MTVRRPLARAGCVLALMSGGLAGFPTAVAEPDATVLCHGVPATIVGTEGDDTLVGTDHRDVIAALGGKDLVHGNGGDDLICGGTSAPRNRPDTLFGDGGNDIIYGDDVEDDGRGGLDSQDRLHGGPGRDQLFGMGGVDTLFGEGGGDVLRGGTDRYHQGKITGIDSVEGGPGDDLLDVGLDPHAGDGIIGVVSFKHSASGVHVDLVSGTATGEGHDRIVESQRLYLIGSGYDDVLAGSDGPDALFGEAGGDRLLGRGGDDRLYASATTGGVRGHRDVLLGGPGADELKSLGVRDVARGGAGTDTIQAGPHLAHARFDGGADNDVLWSVGDTNARSRSVLSRSRAMLSVDDETSSFVGFESFVLDGDHVTYRGGAAVDVVSGYVNDLDARLGSGDDVLSVSMLHLQSGHAVVDAGPGDDEISIDGGHLADLDGGNGSDTVSAWSEQATCVNFETVHRCGR